ncbi:ABC-ATPase domain-containing protein [Pelagicoccus albus]|uniref:ABC-ATPase domain-containing protein n=1 Tax=Pelagicoccus albus TaxID=415222 RepID=A0A7X1B3A7_9BACT|nr:ABC-ATPase domain-containing protein [Pelagicoccus albus]MBC2604861.1 ABC-ATPase domain-containing protein [Pelagicoccus albus]
MRSSNELRTLLQRIDGRPYPAYRDIKGSYDFESFTLRIEKVQGDPFASPSRVSVTISHQRSGLPASTFSNKSRRIGSENCLASLFSKACRKASGQRGSGKSGLISIDTPGQEMLERSCLQIGTNETTASFSLGLPANGRRINGRTASELLLNQLPKIVSSALIPRDDDLDTISRYADAAEDADYLRSQLTPNGLVAFVANGAILPRKSGVDQGPLSEAVAFQSPTTLRRSFKLPHAGVVSGMAIPEGVTLIVGGGYHGKSTLLAAIERGVHNHRPGDGRELVVALSDAAKTRAEDGRSVARIDLSPFIGKLPGDRDSSAFSTQNASGSSSQAASIIESLETGSKVLLLDEDISATNLLIRDERMQKLIAADKEPITPFVQRVRSLYRDCGVSTIIVLGGSGDYFEPADLVIAMDNYLPRDLTQEAKKLSGPSQDAAALSPKKLALQPEQSSRFALPDSINPYVSGRGAQPRSKIKARDLRSLGFGKEEIDLSLVPQLVDSSQVRTIGAALRYAVDQRLFETLSLPEALSCVVQKIEEEGLSLLGDYDLAAMRLQDLAAALNRLRSLKIR